MSHWLENEWRRPTWRRFFLWPISALFGVLVRLRYALYRMGWLASEALPVPVVVIGNIHVGGSGKTPLTIHLANALSAKGWRPGIVSRGYGRESDEVCAVTVDSNVKAVGDEPLLMARSLQSVPIWVGRDRVAAARALLAAHPKVNVLLCDDGLQHYRLARSVSLCVMDGTREQTRCMLPAGPLREPWGRLKHIDAVVWNTHRNDQVLPSGVSSYLMTLVPGGFWQVSHPQKEVTAAELKDKSLHAVAGIGHPARFEKTLKELGLLVAVKPYPDHYAYQAKDFESVDADAVLMTEKDAVKCFSLNNDKLWALRIQADVSPELVAFVESRLKHGC
ncbi:tetraacyldisaccharide 4'-kinase [Leeia sp. TBRC 13508]|uniref:Tetraacyldisaccharide 4'-kinase n=1 Tax=Leeia speluncae TaxID=2884804 RepID=A0ABS8D7G3_9NEIS|nr:tetraacyldisaccharide 4'-kinase [Leeia speluncae]MCB6184145.1 tetraacyldisaccharide 4'-kinase [Leeia speluncae]